MDNKGHPMIKTVGMTAGDEESYSVFADLFDPVIDIRHGGYKPDAKHPTNLDPSQLSSTQIDPSGIFRWYTGIFRRYVFSVVTTFSLIQIVSYFPTPVMTGGEVCLLCPS
jgi:hypothetical protein